MNMDQVMVCVYTDREHRTSIIDLEEFWELLTCSAPTGRILHRSRDLEELWEGEFSYPLLTQTVINGDFDDWEEIAKELNENHANRSECNNYHESHADKRGVYAFVNAGSLDVSLFSRWVWNADPTSDEGRPSDYKMWMEARKGNHISCNHRELAEVYATLGIQMEVVTEETPFGQGSLRLREFVQGQKKAAPVKSSSTKKPWVL